MLQALKLVSGNEVHCTWVDDISEIQILANLFQFWCTKQTKFIREISFNVFLSKVRKIHKPCGILQARSRSVKY